MEYFSKINRQLQIYLEVLHTEYHGPTELMRRFEISFRTLQRDLADFRDAGVMLLELDKKHDNYLVKEKKPEFNDSVTGRRREHLIRLKRLTTLIDKIPEANLSELDAYNLAIEEYECYRDELMVEDPERFPPEELGNPPEKPDFVDIGGIYKNLFPERSRRTRERDFNELSLAGYPIYYDRENQVYICEGAVNYDY